MDNINLDQVSQIHNHIYADTYKPKDKPYAQFAFDLERAIRIKDFKWLMLILGHGRGFNDRSKEIFCDIVGINRVYQLKDLKSAISEFCSISVEAIDLHYAYYAAKDKHERKKEALIDAFGNGSELAVIVDQKIADGYNSVKKHGRNTYLVNSNNLGWHLHRVPIKEYAIASVEFLDIANRYNANVELRRKPNQLAA